MLYKKLLTSSLSLCLLTSGVLHSTSTQLTKYQQAVVCYAAKNYYEASRLLEEALPLLRGKKEEATAHFYHAYCSFHQKKYLQSSDRFKYFCETFPRDPHVEEATYMQGHTLYEESPYVEVDQASTEEAVYVLQSYLNRYPQGAFADKASAQLEALDNKLALKAFSSAKLYHQLTHYRAAVVALGNFQKDFPGSFHNEEVAYLKVDAQHKYYQKVQQAREKAKTYLKIASHREDPPSIESKGDKTPFLEQGAYEKERPYTFDDRKQFHEKARYDEEQQEIEHKDQLSTTIKYCQEFLDNYPDSPYALAVGAIYDSLSCISRPQTP